MTSLNINLYLFLENLLFFVIATLFIVVVTWGWKRTKSYTLPLPFPGWYKVWFGSVQLLGVVPPLVVMLLWGVWWGDRSVLTVLVWYFIVLGLQIISERVMLRQLQNVAWVMIPYIYLPYRFWQLYEGLTLLDYKSELQGVRYLLVFELVLWIVNYTIDVSQLPRLFHWEVPSNFDAS